MQAFIHIQTIELVYMTQFCRGFEWSPLPWFCKKHKIRGKI